jgi:hypothetical protein
MKKKQLILQLLIQDMRHYQLIHLLKKKGMNTDLHYLEIVTLVGNLMGASPGKLSDLFVGLYMSFMEEAAFYKITGRGENLQILAEHGYGMLKCCLEIEGRVEGEV